LGFGTLIQQVSRSGFLLKIPRRVLKEEKSCYGFLLDALHPDGLRCPNGHLLPTGQAPHDCHRAPILDYRCRECGAVYNLFTGTDWSKTRYSCKTIVLILRGISEGMPTQVLANQFKVDRSHLSEKRPAFESLIEERLSNYCSDRHSGPGRTHRAKRSRK
jgi:transposase-like protein